MTFLDIITAVKQEGRVNTSSDLDAMIKRIINESILKYSRNKEFAELHKLMQDLPITSAAQSQYTFPVDGQKITELLYSTDGLSYRPLKAKNQFQAYGVRGYPEWYFRSGASIYIYPFDEILTTHFFQISYYRQHPPLVDDTDLLMVDDLYPTVLNETLGRVRRYHDDFNGAKQYKEDALQGNSLIQQ